MNRFNNLVRNVKKNCMRVLFLSFFISLFIIAFLYLPKSLSGKDSKDQAMSAAKKRLIEKWRCDYRESTNEFFTNFYYTPITGLKYKKGISRRDPSKILKINGIYYVWYTLRKTKVPPVGHQNATDEKPGRDWDLADIGYATSKDGFHWEEQGIAVKRLPKGEYGWRSICTPDILVWKGKYYLYYQAYNGIPGPEHLATVTVAMADSPDGPWTPLGKPVLDSGPPGSWDCGAIRDPFPLVYKGKIYLYYTGNSGWGVAISKNPLGPFKKHPLNPVMNSGHEACLFPWKGGIAAIVSLNGPEKNTVQYAEDGINFEIKSIIINPPIAPGPFIFDAFADNGNGRGITWGLCHMSPRGQGVTNENILARFECDLSLDVKNPPNIFKRHNIRLKSETFFNEFGLPENVKKRIIEERVKREKNTIIDR